MLLTNAFQNVRIKCANLYRNAKKEVDCMKKFYTKPELEVTELLAEDILTASNDDTGILDDEVTVDIGDLFN